MRQMLKVILLCFASLGVAAATWACDSDEERVIMAFPSDSSCQKNGVVDDDISDYVEKLLKDKEYIDVMIEKHKAKKDKEEKEVSGELRGVTRAQANFARTGTKTFSTLLVLFDKIVSGQHCGLCSVQIL